jgi:hypothetical protein
MRDLLLMLRTLSHDADTVWCDAGYWRTTMLMLPTLLLLS